MTKEILEIHYLLDGHPIQDGRQETIEETDILLGKTAIGDISQIVGLTPSIQMAVCESIERIKSTESSTKIPQFTMQTSTTCKFNTNDGVEEVNGQFVPRQREVVLEYDTVTDMVTIQIPAGLKLLVVNELF